MMPRLLFEIWHDPDDHSYEMAAVSAEADTRRRTFSPRAVRLYAFTAASSFDASRINNAWHGWNRWTPEPDWEDQPFTDADRAAPDAYLVIRAPQPKDA